MNLGVGCSGEINEFRAARDKVARLAVHERHLPFHAERWFGRAGGCSAGIFTHSA